MSTLTEPVSPERLAALARVMVERARGAPAPAAVETACRAAAKAVPAAERAQVLGEVERFWPARAAAKAEAARPVENVQLGGTQELMRQKAALELKLAAEQDKSKTLETSLRREQEEHRQAIEALSLQQKRIKELQDERAKLLTEVGETESKLRLQIAETEQAQLKFEKLKSSRQLMGDAATEQLATINSLKEENERLRRQAEEMLKERDQKVVAAQAAAAVAESDSSEAAFGRVWKRLHEAVPDAFLATHVPDESTFARIAEALTECLRALAAIELHVHQFLRDLRQVGAENDQLARFYLLLTKNPGLFETLRDFVSLGKGRGNFTNLIRAHQAWARAFSSGLYKAIVRSPVILSEEMNYRKWPIKASFTVPEDVALGRYYKETALKNIPEKIGTELRRHAADMAYEDYNELMKRR